MVEKLDTEEEERLNSGNPRQILVDSINDKRVDTVNAEILESGGTVEPMHPGEEEVVEDELPAEEEDPLMPFIETGEDGIPMFKMTVDGEEVLMPLDEVRTSHQLDTASRKRMEENSNWAKNLAEREDKIRQTEDALETQLAVIPEPTSLPDSDDRDFTEEAQNFVDTLIDKDANDAVPILANMLKENSNRTPSQAPIDEKDLVNRTAAAVTDKIKADLLVETEADREADFKRGLAQFKKDYPEVHNDPKLFGAANNLTNIIAKEEGHEDWTPSQIILEAGKRTQEWIDDIRRPELDPDKNDRQARKDKLVVVPPARTGTRPAPEEEEPQTASDVLAEIRAERGQPS